eukprot:14219-Eustigmatos_ZCMA.PRE.1
MMDASTVSFLPCLLALPSVLIHTCTHRHDDAGCHCHYTHYDNEDDKHNAVYAVTDYDANILDLVLRTTMTMM